MHICFYWWSFRAFIVNFGMHTRLSHLQVQGHRHATSSSPNLFRYILPDWVIIYT